MYLPFNKTFQGDICIFSLNFLTNQQKHECTIMSQMCALDYVQRIVSSNHKCLANLLQGLDNCIGSDYSITHELKGFAIKLDTSNN